MYVRAIPRSFFDTQSVPPRQEFGPAGRTVSIVHIKRHQDATGQAVYDCYRGLPAYEIIERSDGFIAITGGPAAYLSRPTTWRPQERAALREVRGRVLDIGCNAGRHAVYLQARRHAVVGIDVSPLAIKTARLRGLKHAHVMSITEVTPQLGMFDTILMLGNNFGLFGSAARARRLLRRFTRLTTPNARLIAESRDIYQTDEPLHRRYHAMNRRRGRTAGQIRMRARYKNLVSPWFDYLMVSKAEMETIVRGTGWTVERYFGPGPVYIAVLSRQI